MKRSWARRALVIVVAATCYYSWLCYRVPLHFGLAEWLNIARADSVELFRLNPKKGRTIEQQTIAGPFKPSSEWTQKVVNRLGDSRNYGWDIAKACVMMPGVALRFRRGRSAADVLFCFECKMLSIGKPGERPRTEDFDPMGADLVALMKQAFPKDSVIQSLTWHDLEERSRR